MEARGSATASAAAKTSGCKITVEACAGQLLGESLVRHDGPSAILANLHEQEADNRLVLHLLHAVPERRPPDLDIIEELLPLHDLSVTIGTRRIVKSVQLVPCNEALVWKQSGAALSFATPCLNEWGSIAIELEQDA